MNDVDNLCLKYNWKIRKRPFSLNETENNAENKELYKKLIPILKNTIKSLKEEQDPITLESFYTQIKMREELLQSFENRLL